MKESKQIMIIYDGHGPKGKMIMTTTDFDGKTTIDMTGHKSVTVIDISDLHTKVQVITEKENYPKKKVSELTEMTPRTIQYYTDEGLLVPVENPSGRGVTRKYSKYNLFQLLVIRELAKHGHDLGTIKDILDVPFLDWKVRRTKD